MVHPLFGIEDPLFTFHFIFFECLWAPTIVKVSVLRTAKTYSAVFVVLLKKTQSFRASVQRKARQGRKANLLLTSYGHAVTNDLLIFFLGKFSTFYPLFSA